MAQGAAQATRIPVLQTGQELDNFIQTLLRAQGSSPSTPSIFTLKPLDEGHTVVALAQPNGTTEMYIPCVDKNGRAVLATAKDLRNMYDSEGWIELSRGLQDELRKKSGLGPNADIAPALREYGIEMRGNKVFALNFIGRDPLGGYSSDKLWTRNNQVVPAPAGATLVNTASTQNPGAPNERKIITEAEIYDARSYRQTWVTGNTAPGTLVTPQNDLGAQGYKYDFVYSRTTQNAEVLAIKQQIDVLNAATTNANLVTQAQSKALPKNVISQEALKASRLVTVSAPIPVTAPPPAPTPPAATPPAAAIAPAFPPVATLDALRSNNLTAQLGVNTVGNEDLRNNAILQLNRLASAIGGNREGEIIEHYNNIPPEYRELGRRMLLAKEDPANRVVPFGNYIEAARDLNTSPEKVAAVRASLERGNVPLEVAQPTAAQQQPARTPPPPPVRAFNVAGATLPPALDPNPAVRSEQVFRAARVLAAGLDRGIVSPADEQRLLAQFKGTDYEHAFDNYATSRGSMIRRVDDIHTLARSPQSTQPGNNVPAATNPAISRQIEAAGGQKPNPAVTPAQMLNALGVAPVLTASGDPVTVQMDGRRYLLWQTKTGNDVDNILVDAAGVAKLNSDAIMKVAAIQPQPGVDPKTQAAQQAERIKTNGGALTALTEQVSRGMIAVQGTGSPTFNADNNPAGLSREANAAVQRLRNGENAGEALERVGRPRAEVDEMDFQRDSAKYYAAAQEPGMKGALTGLFVNFAGGNTQGSTNSEVNVVPENKVAVAASVGSNSNADTAKPAGNTSRI